MLCNAPALQGNTETPVSDSHCATGKRILTARKVLQCSQSSHRPPLPVRQVRAAGKPAPAGARRAPCERPPARCLRKGRRLTDHASSASVDAVFHSRHRTAAGRTDDRTGRSRLLFVLFFPQRKEHASPFQRRKYVLFSAGRKDTKRAVEATASNSHASVGKRIHTAPNRRNRAPACALRHSPCGK